MPMQQKSAQCSYSRPGPSKHDLCVEARPPNSQILSGASSNQILEPWFHPMEYLALAIGNQCPCSKSWLKDRIAGQGPRTWPMCGAQNSKQPNSRLHHPKSNPWAKILPHGIFSPWYGQPMPMQQKLAQGSYSRPGPSKHGPCVEAKTSKQPNSIRCNPKSNHWDKISPHRIVSTSYGQPRPMQQKLAQGSYSRPGSLNMSHVWCPELQTANFPPTPPQIKSLCQNSTPWNT